MTSDTTLKSHEPRLLVGCECSGRVRDAFIAQGVPAVSCDLKPSETPGPHIQGDVLDHLKDGYAGAIFHPWCTHLASSGAKWFYRKQREQEEALRFVRKLLDAPIPFIALENPVGVISTRIRKPDQIVQPFMFGDSFRKTTCLWLKGFPRLKPTKIVSEGGFHITKGGRKLPSWYNLPPSPERSTIRARTFPGFAKAMAEQWGPLL